MKPKDGLPNMSVNGQAAEQFAWKFNLQNSIHGLELLKENIRWSDVHLSCIKMNLVDTTSVPSKKLQSTCPMASTRRRWSKASHHNNGCWENPWPTCTASLQRSSIQVKSHLTKLELFHRFSKSAFELRWHGWKPTQTPNCGEPSTKSSKTFRTCWSWDKSVGTGELPEQGFCRRPNGVDPPESLQLKTMKEPESYGFVMEPVWSDVVNDKYDRWLKKLVLYSLLMSRLPSRTWKTWRPDQQPNSEMWFRLKSSPLWKTTWKTTILQTMWLTMSRALVIRTMRVRYVNKLFLVWFRWFCRYPCRTQLLNEIEHLDVHNMDLQMTQHDRCRSHQQLNLREIYHLNKVTDPPAPEESLQREEAMSPHRNRRRYPDVKKQSKLRVSLKLQRALLPPRAMMMVYLLMFWFMKLLENCQMVGVAWMDVLN